MADTEPMVQFALAQLGKAYVWGATGTDVYDCSSLVQESAKRAGITVGRTTYQQINNGEPVIGDPQRGDIVFPHAGHVVIALGGDQCVHAPQTGEVVKIAPYWTAPMAIRRLGTNSGSPGSTSTSGSYGTTSAFDLPNALTGGADDKIRGIMNAFESFATLISVTSQEGTWYRIAKYVLGILVVILGIGALGISLLGGGPKHITAEAKRQFTSARKVIA